MHTKPLRLFLVLALWFSVVLIPASPVAAAGTTSIRVVKYQPDGTTIIDERTIDYATMQSSLPVQGDGIREFYHQGPTFDPANFWDPTETLNLKAKGALKGTDLRDLCELVGGMAPGDTVRVMAIDGFSKTFDYANVYHPTPEQGKIVVSWYAKGYGHVPTWEDGMMLAFFAETTNSAGQYVFGNLDMQRTMPENRWHYYDIYPSSNGYTIKNVGTIAIYSSSSPGGQERNSASMNVSATVVLPTVGISLNRSSVDYGEIEPGTDSAVVDVDITNIGSRDVSVTLEVQGNGAIAQSFYEQSLYVNGTAYPDTGVIAWIDKGQTQTVDTQLRVPPDWIEPGKQEALFVFWAEAAD
ncbi:MAG: hypothetical protein GX552_18995 [Chloroflexi bacterium]|jgi:hypothetical protein|nr:hypothetical protein [Chloroflexota bacterium]